jgi:hypothetical protein
MVTGMKSEIKSSGALRGLQDALDKPKKARAAGKAKPTEDELLSFVEQGVRLALDEKNANTAAVGPGRRLLGWWSDMWDAIEEAAENAACGLWATAATPPYLLAYGVFHACNSGLIKLSNEQRFFQRPIYAGTLLDAVNVKYGACFPPGFGSAAATTMGKEIYVRAAKANNDANAITTMSVSGSFKSQTELLIHELGHSLQYSNRGWNIGVFGWDYMFQYCKAGFSYSGNSMEKSAEAFRYQTKLIFSGQPIAHFKKFRKDSSTVGWSKNKEEYSDWSIGTTKIMSLDLVKTSNTKTGESQRKAGTVCVRILRANELGQRKSANIATRPWDCVDKPPTKAPTKTPTKKPTKKPTKAPTPFTVAGGGTIGTAPTPKPVPLLAPTPRLVATTKPIDIPSIPAKP